MTLLRQPSTLNNTNTTTSTTHYNQLWNTAEIRSSTILLLNTMVRKIVVIIIIIIIIVPYLVACLSRGTGHHRNQLGFSGGKYSISAVFLMFNCSYSWQSLEDTQVRYTSGTFMAMLMMMMIKMFLTKMTKAPCTVVNIHGKHLGKCLWKTSDIFVQNLFPMLICQSISNLFNINAP